MMLPRVLADAAYDVRLALRVLRRRPALTLAVTAVLALGIGASTTIFSGVHGVLLRPLPFESPEEIVVAWGERPASGRPQIELSWPEFADWARESRSFEHTAAFPFATLGVTLGGAGDPARIAAVPVSADFFRVLGADARIGRTFAAGEDRPGTARLVVLGHGLWRERFGADSAVIDRTILLDGEPYTVIGVMPSGFDFPRGTDAWTTLGAAVPFAADDRRLGFLMMLGRLREGVTPELAREELSSVARRLAAQATLPEPAEAAVVTPLPQHFFGPARPASLLLLGASALLLVLAVANVAGLLLVRATARRHEMAVRLAIGAGRGRVVRQQLVESLVLASAGGVAGVLLAGPAISVLAVLVPDSVPRAESISLDGTALIVAALLTIVVALAAGVLPALRAIPSAGAGALRSAARGTPDRRARRAMDGLIIAQIATSMVLLFGAGLIGRSLRELERAPLGFEPRDVLSAQVSLPGTAYATVEQQRQFMRDLVERVRTVPGVVSAAAVLVRPLEGPIGFNFPFRAEGQDSAAAAANPLLNYQSVTPGYFATMRIPLVSGRTFADRDTEESAGVVIIGRSLAERMWPGEVAVGRRMRLPNQRRPADEWLEVIGVVEDVRARELRATTLDVYVPMAQSQFAPQFLVVRTEGMPLAAVPAIRAHVAALDPTVPLARIATMEQQHDALLAAPRLGAVLLAGFALAALLLAAVGLYGVLAYSVTQRTREIGIRMALGARAGDVRRLVAAHAGRLTVLGIVIGLLPALLGTRAVSRFLHGVQPLDAPTVIGVALVLGGAALVATWLPSRRAVRVDPAVAMRAEE